MSLWDILAEDAHRQLRNLVEVELENGHEVSLEARDFVSRCFGSSVQLSVAEIRKGFHTVKQKQQHTEVSEEVGLEINTRIVIVCVRSLMDTIGQKRKDIEAAVSYWGSAVDRPLSHVLLNLPLYAFRVVDFRDLHQTVARKHVLRMHRKALRVHEQLTELMGALAKLQLGTSMAVTSDDSGIILHQKPKRSSSPIAIMQRYCADFKRYGANCRHRDDNGTCDWDKVISNSADEGKNSVASEKDDGSRDQVTISRPWIKSCDAIYLAFDELNSHVNKLSTALYEVKRPPFVIRNWLPIATLGFGSLLVGRTIYGNSAAIAASLWDLATATSQYFRNYVVSPILEIYETIRYDRKSMSLTSHQALLSNSESLERMVLDFVGDVAAEKGIDTSTLKEQIRLGDLTVVLEQYEKDMRSPLKGAIFGNLVRSVLIQVQKEKVDVEKTLFALDKLMSANELNFKILAAVPTVGIFLGVSRYLYHRVFLSERLSEAGAKTEIRRRTRQLVRLLELFNAHNGPEPLSAMDHGRIYLNLEALFAASGSLRVRLQRPFREDLQDLARTDRSPGDKICAVQRMYQSYSFLYPLVA
eukprot:Clim_evm11s246 gene=Clim_evmTU11s246